jgi:tRNA U34 5-methylaminomethyl-2-thiouridine-forming methyltransferase MnmC
VEIADVTNAWPAGRDARLYGRRYACRYFAIPFAFSKYAYVPETRLVPTQKGYRIVKLSSGAHSVHSLAHGETFHPVVGPVAEAEVLYVRQVRLLERLRAHHGEFVIWDVGLGAAANPITVLRSVHDLPCQLRVVSFDHTLEPLKYALEQTNYLPYLAGYEERLQKLLRHGVLQFTQGTQTISWEIHVADFPNLIGCPEAGRFAKPNLIMFDAFSLATNPAMWTQPLFASLFGLLDPKRPCALPTYSRSTMLRVTLLLAGFFVGVGHPTGQKEETTIAANKVELIEEPLDGRWLQRAQRSTSAEPMWEPPYRQARLTASSLAKLREHPQFA